MFTTCSGFVSLEAKDPYQQTLRYPRSYSSFIYVYVNTLFVLIY